MKNTKIYLAFLLTLIASIILALWINTELMANILVTEFLIIVGYVVIAEYKDL